MTAFVPTASIIGNTPVFTTVAANDSLTLLQPFTFINTLGMGVNIVHFNTAVLNMTTLLSGGDNAVSIGGVSDCDITNTASGTIATLSDIYGFAAIYMTGDRNAVHNAGLIYATNGTGVQFSGDDVLVNNSGTIRGLTYAVLAIGVDYVIHNSGTLESGEDAFPTTVYMAGSGAGKYLNNSGVVQSLDAASGLAVLVAGSNLTSIDNSGLIRSVGGTAIDAGTATGELYLNNSGTISAANFLNFAVVATDLADIILNSGTLNGSVALGLGADLFNGLGGHVLGTIIGGAGSDTYVTDDAALSIQETDAEVDSVQAAVTFRLAAFVENLTLLGNGNFNGFGNAGLNVITGNAGENRLLGLAGNDTISGDLGNDRLLGGSDTDSLDGGDGDDVVLGGSGTDTVRGGDGDDVVNGGAAKDLLAGNLGADVFVFSALSHTGNLTTTADVISDFVKGDDLIDLSALDAISTNAKPNDAFAFIGTAAFGSVAGQLRVAVSGANTYIEMDIDGDSLVDAMVRISGLPTLNASDFVL